jgi:hypothetical protein
MTPDELSSSGKCVPRLPAACARRSSMLRAAGSSSERPPPPPPPAAGPAGDAASCVQQGGMVGCHGATSMSILASQPLPPSLASRCNHLHTPALASRAVPLQATQASEALTGGGPLAYCTMGSRTSLLARYTVNSSRPR